MAADIDRLIAAIWDDRVHGAAELGRRAAEVLILAADGRLDNAADQLRAAQPSMATIWNACRIAVEARSRGPAAVIAACRDFMDRMDRATADIARHAADLFSPGTAVVTHSASQAVFEALRCAHALGMEFRVMGTESQPGGEGIEFAQRLRAAGIHATVIEDSKMTQAMDAAAFALVGADSVNSSEVVNKVGTRALTLAAQERHKPVYVLCPSMKVWDRTAPPSELFEAIPRHFFAGILTEKGMLRTT